jgi:hypothetical protein
MHKRVIIYLLTIISSAIYFSCGTKNKNPSNKNSTGKNDSTNILYNSKDSSSISITKEVDTLYGGNNINLEIENTNYFWKKYKHFWNPGWGYSYALVKEHSIQKILDSDRSTDGKILLEVTCPNTNPVSDTFNFNETKWKNTFVANEVKYTSEYIQLIRYRERDGYNNTMTLCDYWTGKQTICYSSKLYAIKNPEKPDHLLIGYLELPDINNEKISEPNLYGILSIYNPNMSKQIIIKIYKEYDEAEELNFYRDLSFKEIAIKGKVLKSDKEDYFKNLEIADEKIFMNLDDFMIEIKYEGVKNITLIVPFANTTVDQTNIMSKDFSFKVEETQLNSN